MTLISFAGRIRVRPEVSFHHCASEERMRDTIDLTRVCTGFSYNLKLSNLSHLGRMLLKPRRKRPLYQDSHPKERSGSEDSVGAWCPGRQGRVWLLPSAARFAFLPFPESISQVSGLCSPLCRCEEGSYSGLGGNTDWSKASWGSARVGRLRTALIPLGLAQAQGLTRSQLCHSVTCLKTSFQTLPHDETDVRG